MRALGSGFSVFHESSRKGPEPVARFYGSAAQEDLPFPFGNAADDNSGIFIVDVAAAIANVSVQGIAIGDDEGDLRAATVTELNHG